VQIESTEDLKKDLARNGYRPVYAIVGPEQYLVRQAFLTLKENAVPEGLIAMNYEEFRVPEDSAEEILAAANTFPMIAPRRMVVVHEFDKLDERGRESLVAYLQAPAAKTILVLLSTEVDRRTVLFRNIKNSTALVECTKLEVEGLKRWAGDFVRERGYTIKPAALDRIVELAGSDIESLANQLEKILLFTGNSKTVPDNAIDDLVQSSREHGIFELTEAIGLGNRTLALKLLANLLEADQDPIYIAVMMARHFRQLLIGREALENRRSEREAADAAQVPNFFKARDSFLRHLRLIDSRTAARMCRELAVLDLRFKSSQGDPRILLEKLICSL